VLPWRYDAELGITNSLQALEKYGEYNERIGLVKIAYKFLEKRKQFFLSYFLREITNYCQGKISI